MNWTTLTRKAGSAPPDEMEVPCNNETDKITLAGPGFYGWIYRSKTRPLCYRLVPIDDAPLEWRNEVQQWIGRHRPAAIAPITKAWQQEADRIYFCIRYEVAGLEQTLKDALAAPDALVRMKHAALAARELPVWWEALYSPLMIMPADVVFADGQARLLAAPAMDAPAIDMIFQEPVRSLYLAPELARGRGEQDSKNADRYAMGVMLLQCFYKMPAFDDPGSILVRSLTRELFSLSGLESALPFWMEDIPATRQAVAAISRMVDTDPEARRSVEPEKIAALLEASLRRMDAQVVALELRNLGQPFEAYSLLQNVMLTQETYDLLLLAGEIAGRDLSRPLEAVDFFERAIAKEPARSEAYLSQFDVFASAPELAPLRDMISNSSSAAAQVDVRLQRDFAIMPAAKQEEHEADAAWYLVWRNQTDAAISFIRSRLYDGQTYMWWKFDLNLAYVHALVAQGKLEEAQQRISDIKSGLAKARQNQTVAEDEIHRCGAAVAEIEADIFRIKSAPGAQI